MSLQKLKCRIVGLLPLIQHRGGLANPLDPHTKAMKAISGKRKKVDADFEQLSKLEFLGSLYTFDGCIVIPDFMLEATIIEGARKEKQGKVALAAIFAKHAVLEYDGPQEPEKLWEAEQFRYIVGVRVGQARVMRTRPKFDKWAANIELEYEDSMIDRDNVLRMFRTAGEQIGIGDRRPKFGRFRVEAA